MTALTRKEMREEEVVPREIQGVLKSFEDVMVDQLPQRLHPQRAVDHHNELLLSVKPFAKGFYLMALPELVEL